MTFFKYLPLALALTSAPALADFSQADKADAFVKRMQDKHGFEPEQVRGWLKQSTKIQRILDLMSSPAEGKPWHEYRKIFMGQRRIDGGVAFWNEHAETLTAAEEKYGVDPAIIVAILGVETRYGGYTGGYKVFDATATLGFAYPRRSKFFLGQLEHFLLLAREEGIDPFEPKGSYAGAMGMPQFIPSSYRDYAVDFDGDGKRDIWNNPKDVIGSVANYFARHGWKKGEPVATPASLKGSAYKNLVAKKRKPEHTLGELQAAGVSIEPDWPADAPALLLDYDQKDGKDYWVGRQNFYVITRYNHSKLYGMAVYQLSQAIKAARDAQS